MATKEGLERGKRDIFSQNKFCYNWCKYFTHSTSVEKLYKTKCLEIRNFSIYLLFNAA